MKERQKILTNSGNSPGPSPGPSKRRRLETRDRDELEIEPPRPVNLTCTTGLGYEQLWTLWTIWSPKPLVDDQSIITTQEDYTQFFYDKLKTFNTEFEFPQDFDGDVHVVNISEMPTIRGNQHTYPVKMRDFRGVRYTGNWTMELFGDLAEVLSPGLTMGTAQSLIIIGGSTDYSRKTLKLNWRLTSTKCHIIHFLNDGKTGPEEHYMPFGDFVETGNIQMVYYTSSSASGTVLRMKSYFGDDIFVSAEEDDTDLRHIVSVESASDLNPVNVTSGPVNAFEAAAGLSFDGHPSRPAQVNSDASPSASTSVASTSSSVASPSASTSVASASTSVASPNTAVASASTSVASPNTAVASANTSVASPNTAVASANSSRRSPTKSASSSHIRVIETRSKTIGNDSSRSPSSPEVADSAENIASPNEPNADGDRVNVEAINTPSSPSKTAVNPARTLRSRDGIVETSNNVDGNGTPVPVSNNFSSPSPTQARTRTSASPNTGTRSNSFRTASSGSKSSSRIEIPDSAVFGSPAQARKIIETRSKTFGTGSSRSPSRSAELPNPGQTVAGPSKSPNIGNTTSSVSLRLRSSDRIVETPTNIDAPPDPNDPISPPPVIWVARASSSIFDFNESPDNSVRNSPNRLIASPLNCIGTRHANNNIETPMSSVSVRAPNSGQPSSGSRKSNRNTDRNVTTRTRSAPTSSKSSRMSSRSRVDNARQTNPIRLERAPAGNNYIYSSLQEYSTELEEYGIGEEEHKAIGRQCNVYGVVEEISICNLRDSYECMIYDETLRGVRVRIHTSPQIKRIGPVISKDQIIRVHRATIQEEFTGERREMVISTSPHHNYTLFNHDPNITGDIQRFTCAKNSTFKQSDHDRVIELRQLISSRRSGTRTEPMEEDSENVSANANSRGKRRAESCCVV